ncbi:hypothetical protein B1R94_17205 [Mycolicibacterium litorale]|nr:hypothetical protein B1R94_17205 [Mycolicibacterium litorale]
MRRQARAEATRRRIIDAAVELFAAIGYGDTSLADIVKAAKVTKGAFYYHFTSKEAVAEAIIGESNERVAAAYADATREARPALEKLIAGSYAIAGAIRSDTLVGIGNQLIQSLSQIGDTGGQVYPRWKSIFAEEANAAATAGQLRDGMIADDVGEAIYVSMVGCQLLSDAIGDDAFDRLARAWRILLRAVAPGKALAELDDFLIGTRQLYRDPTR